MLRVLEFKLLEGNCPVNLCFFFHIETRKLPNLESNSRSFLSGSYPQVHNCLMVRWYESGRVDHELDLRLGDLFLYIYISLNYVTHSRGCAYRYQACNIHTACI